MRYGPWEPKSSMDPWERDRALGAQSQAILKVSCRKRKLYIYPILFLQCTIYTLYHGKLQDLIAASTQALPSCVVYSHTAQLSVPRHHMQSQDLPDSLPSILLFILQSTMTCIVFLVGVGGWRGWFMKLRDCHWIFLFSVTKSYPKREFKTGIRRHCS